MELLYLIGVKAYGLSIVAASLFSRKARQWVSGRSNWKHNIRKQLQPGENRILFHCSSLGEFEQGKPVLEAIRKEYPGYKIVLTFFSPSGYEIRKKDPLADYVFYLPLDGPLNAPAFIDLVNPSAAFFVKYDFWHYYIKGLKDRKIPVFFVSSIFRPSQLFFQPYGGFFMRMLKRVTHMFVQNQESLELLYKNSIPQVTVTGDTRFDRVFRNSIESKHFPQIAAFKGEKNLLVAGSTWPHDESLLAQAFRQLHDGLQLIIAPHEIGESKIRSLEKLFHDYNPVRFSAYEPSAGKSSAVLIIDNIGLLSSIYKYGDCAYIGGGFGKGIHNILEAAVYGIPVFFGPKYQKFREARELVHWKGAFAVKSADKLVKQFRELAENPASLERIRSVNSRYIQNNKGATELIIEFLRLNTTL